MRKEPALAVVTVKIEISPTARDGASRVLSASSTSCYLDVYVHAALRYPVHPPLVLLKNRAALDQEVRKFMVFEG